MIFCAVFVQLLCSVYAVIFYNLLYFSVLIKPIWCSSSVRHFCSLMQ